MLNKKIGLLALFAGFAASEIMAGTLTNYTTGDILLGFRNGQGRNLVVDVGPYTSLIPGPANQIIPITQYTASQINTTFGDTDGLTWSAFSWLDDSTLFVTKKRVNLNVQSAVPNAQNVGLQGSAALQMDPVRVGAKYQYDNLDHPTYDITTTAVNEPQADTSYPSGAGKSYYNAVSGNGTAVYTFGGTLPSGDPEVSTPGNFATSGTVVRNDLYQIPPGVGKSGVIYLGYFEMATDGTMTFVSKPSTTPVIKSIARQSNDSIISYIAGQYGTYTLRGTNVLSGAVTNWPAITTVTSGDTATHSVTNTTSADIMFYSITAQ